VLDLGVAGHVVVKSRRWVCLQARNRPGAATTRIPERKPGPRHRDREQGARVAGIQAGAGHGSAEPRKAANPRRPTKPLKGIADKAVLATCRRWPPSPPLTGFLCQIRVFCYYLYAQAAIEK
jgi:hypothetical protein